jgi:hypothetical protein
MPPKAERFEMRMERQLLKRVDQWRSKQPGLPPREEAICQLVTAILHILDKNPGEKSEGNKKSASKASSLAAKQIDLMGDKSATHEQRARRKRRLLKGPKEFRATRRNHSKAKI